MPTDDEQSNGAAGFASSDVKEFLVGVNRMNLRSDKLGSKDRTPSHDSRSSRHRRRRRITSSSDECNRRGDGGDDVSSSTSPANQEDVAGEANHVVILSAYSELGRTRTQSHFMEYFIYNEDNEKTMSDKTVDLTKIDFTAEVSKSKCDEQVILQTSTTAKELEKFTKDILMERITNMRNIETNKSESERVNISEPVPKKSANKTRVIEYLVKWRSEVFKKNPTMKDTLEEEVKRNFADKCRSTPESRDELLKDTIFWLSDSVRQNERYSAVINSH